METTINSKVCFKCGALKPLTEYYTHKAMGDGHLNKCKTCTKSDTKKRLSILKDDPDWMESERTRGRKKHMRLYRFTSKAKPEITKRHAAKYPEKQRAKNFSASLKKPFPAAERHHWSYNDAHYKDVIWLSKTHHMKAHRFIVYDQPSMMYRRYDTNELLDTRDKHSEFIFHCIKTKED